LAHSPLNPSTLMQRRTLRLSDEQALLLDAVVSEHMSRYDVSQATAHRDLILLGALASTHRIPRDPRRDRRLFTPAFLARRASQVLAGLADGGYHAALDGFLSTIRSLQEKQRHHAELRSRLALERVLSDDPESLPDDEALASAALSFAADQVKESWRLLDVVIIRDGRAYMEALKERAIELARLQVGSK
jgi:hypothetical protein